MPTASKDAAGWQVAYTIAGTGEKTITFKTENRFVDADARATITTPAATEPTLSLTDITTDLPMGTATSGKYSPTVSLSGNANIKTAGWIAAGNHTVSDTSVAIGTVNQSLIKNGTSTIASGSTITPGSDSQTISITEGYNSARTIVIGSASSSSPGAVTSGSATIDTLSYAYVSADSAYNITGSADVTAPTVNTAGYVSGSIGTLSANEGGAVVAASVPAIKLNSTLSGATTARKPTLSKQAISISGVTDAASDNATATAPTSGVYVAVRSAANTATINSAPAIATAGYGAGSNFIQGTYATATVGAAQSDIYYVPITTTTASVSGRNVTYGTGWITAGTSSIPVGTITSGAGTATISTPTYDSTNDNFTQTASGAIAAPSVGTAGYVSSTEGTKNTNSISGSKTLDVVQVGVTVSGSAKVTPDITRTAKPGGDTWVDAASGAVTTTKPTTGAYVQVNAAAKSKNITITGKVSSEGYGTTDHYNTDTATTTTVGSNAAVNTYVPIKVGEITSGRANIDSLTYTYNSSTDNFAVYGVADVAAPTINTTGYVGDGVGTINANTDGATVATYIPKIAIKANLSGTGTKAPSITKNSNTNIPQAGTATTTKPSSGYYVAVSSAANTATVQATATVATAGYGTAVSGQYTTTPSSNLTVGAAASSVTYVPITQATFANTATSGTTYTDISSSAPVLISGDYLYINAGYTPASKISLAKLVPDASGDNAPANYILSGYTAFDNNGVLIVGTMETYDGTYTIT